MSFTAKLEVYNLSALHDAENNPEEMRFKATIYKDKKEHSSMAFKHIDSAHQYINIFMKGENNGD